MKLEKLFFITIYENKFYYFEQKKNQIIFYYVLRKIDNNRLKKKYENLKQNQFNYYTIKINAKPFSEKQANLDKSNYLKKVFTIYSHNV